MEKLDISILLVEDDVVIRNVYTQLLTHKVNELFIAGDGMEGYNSYKTNKPDLIITDIKMPVLNGLDMIRKIRHDDKEQRIIIMSAYGESRFFQTAIEMGVKGFLVKPVDKKDLFEIVDDLSKDILLGKRLAEEEIKRKELEIQVEKGNKILVELAQATIRFFQFGVNTETIDKALKSVGNSAEVSRSYIFKLFTEKNKRYLGQINEWVSEGIDPQIDNPDLKRVPEDSEVFKAWEDLMIHKNNIIGSVEDFNEPSKSILLEQDIKSILAIPIFVKEQWWGFIGFDECKYKRNWTVAEVKALEMLAYNLGAAIYRREVEEELIKLNVNLEDRVRDRTKELEKEIADRTVAESLLRDSEEKYRLIFENANNGIILIISGKIKMLNPKVVEIFGIMPKHMIGYEFSSFIETKYKEKVKETFEKEDLELNDEYEIHVKMLNGKYLELKITNILWDNYPASLLFVSDITKRKIAENNLSDLNLNLEIRVIEEVKRANKQQQLLVQKSKLESLGEVSAGLAHEINQPLGGISMGLENMLFNIREDKENSDYLKNKINLLFRDVERIQKIIEHVRLFSREQERSIKEDVCINSVIVNSLSLVRNQFTGKDIEIETNIPVNQIYTSGNKFRLEQVLLNLLSNARFAVNEKKIKSKDTNFRQKISIDLAENTDSSTITITDNGTGVDNNIVSKVFDPFFSTKSEAKGTGLGLSISYGIISEMNGSITLESEPEEFTKVIIKLPKIAKV